MFGIKPIVGEKVVSVLKNRITIPSFTDIEIGESLQAQYVTKFTNGKNDVHHLSIYSEEEFNKRIEEMDRKLYEAYSTKRINYQQYHNYQRYIYGFLSFMPEEVDKQKRMHLEPRIITDLHINTQAFLVGIKKHLELYPTYESYTSILKEVYLECTEQELPSIIEGNINQEKLTLTSIKPNKGYICVYKIPPVVLYDNNNTGIYTIPSIDISKTFLDRIETPNQEIIYKKEPISFNMI